MSQLINVSKAAAALSISRNFLYRAAERGDAPSYRFGKALRFDLEELKNWSRTQMKTRPSKDALTKSTANMR